LDLFVIKEYTANFENWSGLPAVIAIAAIASTIIAAATASSFTVASVASISICIHFEGPILRIIDFGKLLPNLRYCSRRRHMGGRSHHSQFRLLHRLLHRPFILSALPFYLRRLRQHRAALLK